MVPALYAAVEGRARAAAVRLDVPARPGAHPRRGSRRLGAPRARPERFDAEGPGPLVLSVRTFGGGVIGNTTGSGPVIGGSSPPPRARMHQHRSLAPSSSGRGRRPLKAVTAVRICSGLHTEARLVRVRALSRSACVEARRARVAHARRRVRARRPRATCDERASCARCVRDIHHSRACPVVRLVHELRAHRACASACDHARSSSGYASERAAIVVVVIVRFATCARDVEMLDVSS